MSIYKGAPRIPDLKSFIMYIPTCGSYGPIKGPHYIALYNVPRLFAVQTSLETISLLILL